MSEEESPLDFLEGPGLGDVVAEAVGKAAIEADTLARGGVQALLDGLGELIEEKFFKLIDRFQNWVHTELTIPIVNSPLIPDEMRGDVQRWTSVPTLASLIPALGMAIVGALSEAKAWLEIFGELKAREIRTAHPIHLPGVGDMINLLNLGIVTPDFAQAEALKLGASPEWFHLLQQGSLIWPQPDHIRVMYLRGYIDEGMHDSLLTNIGWAKTAIDAQKIAYQLVPGPSDLIRMSVREAFDDTYSETYGTDTAFPQPFLEAYKQQGGTEYWAQRYWRSHWELPSIQMGFQMLHRGEISHKQLNDLFHALDIMPWWRDKLLAISYHPYTRVDVRRMYGVGILDRPGVVRAYKDLGYDDEKAENLAEFAIRYEAGPEKDITKAEILEGYANKILTKEETITLLVDANYTRGEAGYLVALEDLQQLKKVEKIQVDRAKRLYLQHHISEADVRAALGTLGWTGARIDLTMDEWRDDRLERSAVPSKDDWLRWYKNGQIDANTLKGKLFDLGYDWEYADLYIQEVDIVKQKARAPGGAS